MCLVNPVWAINRVRTARKTEKVRIIEKFGYPTIGLCTLYLWQNKFFSWLLLLFQRICRGHAEPRDPKFLVLSLVKTLYMTELTQFTVPVGTPRFIESTIERTNPSLNLVSYPSWGTHGTF